MSSKSIETPNVNQLGNSIAEDSFDWHDFQPEMLGGKSAFSVELTTYRDLLDTLLEDAGKYAVIKGKELIGIYPDYDSAVEAACPFAPEPVLVKKIVEREPVRVVGHVVH